MSIERRCVCASHLNDAVLDVISDEEKAVVTLVDWGAMNMTHSCVYCMAPAKYEVKTYE